jgi:hypothetical protein
MLLHANGGNTFFRSIHIARDSHTRLSRLRLNDFGIGGPVPAISLCLCHP